MTTRYARRAVVDRTIRGETILVPVANTVEALDSIYALNETAGCVWRAAAGGASHDEIVAALIEEFDVDTETAAAETQRVLAELVAAGVLCVSEGE